MDQGLNLWDAAVVCGIGASEDIPGVFSKICPREQGMDFFACMVLEQGALSS